MGKAKSVKDSRPLAAKAANERWPAAVFIAVAAAYLFWFVQQSPVRVSLLRQLSDPFGLIAQWLGPAGTPLGLLDRTPVLAMAGVIILAAYGVGRLVFGVDRRTMRREQEQLNKLERTVFALAAGLSVLSTMVLLGGLVEMLQVRWLWWPVIVIAAALGVWCIYHDHWSRLWDSHSAFRIPHSAFAWLAVAFAAMILLGACLPPWDFDVREYHLQVPKEWFQQGRITFLPHNVYGNMPLGAEMHALLAMALWPGEDGWFAGALAGKVVIGAYTIMTALGIAAAGERLASKWVGTLAACLYLGHPWVVHVSVSGLNDGALAANVFLAAYGMWLARRGACGFLLPGLMAGAAAACKYPGLVFAVVPLAVWCCLPARNVGRVFNPSVSDGLKTRPTAVALALYLAGVLAGGGAWYAKNAILADNPVYPLAYEVFGGKTRTPENNAQWQRAHQVPPDQHGRKYSLTQLADSAIRISGRDDYASPLVAPLLAVFALAALNPKSKIQNPKSLLPFALLLLLILAVWWLVTHRIDRFLLPAWPLAALLAALGATSFDSVWGRRVVNCFCFAGLAYCLLAAASPLVGDNRWFVSLAQLRRDEPWPAGTPLRVKSEHKFLNAQFRTGDSSPHAPRDESISRSEMPTMAVLLVGEAAVFDLQMPVYYHTCFDSCLLCDWMLGKSADERRAELASRNIAWILVDWPEIRRYRRPGSYGFDPRLTPQLLEELVAQGVLEPPLQPGGDIRQRAAELYPVAGSGPKPPTAAGVP